MHYTDALSSLCAGRENLKRGEAKRLKEFYLPKMYSEVYVDQMVHLGLLCSELG